MKLVAPWIRMSETPCAMAPALVDEVLGEMLGLSASELKDLREKSVIK